MLNPTERSLRARLAALTLHSTRDSREHTRPARTAFLAKFLREVDPNGELPELERLRRAQLARRAHFARMALRSARARSQRAKGKATVGETTAKEGM